MDALAVMRKCQKPVSLVTSQVLDCLHLVLHASLAGSHSDCWL